ncbi:MAG: hypothetical protein HY848_05560 [Betaproteobacteria bacterium]|nr:hypothetical protein [Betaproteobacteria bacterium]
MRAARANRVFRTDKKHPYRKRGYAITPQQLPHPRECCRHFGCSHKHGVEFYTSSSIARGCAFHPCASDDPRGRFFVRAGFAKTCALRAPTLFLVRMKSASVPKTRLCNYSATIAASA